MCITRVWVGLGEGGDRTGWVYVYGCARVQLWAGVAKGTARMDRSVGMHPCIHVLHEEKAGEAMGRTESVGNCMCVHMRSRIQRCHLSLFAHLSARIFTLLAPLLSRLTHVLLLSLPVCSPLSLPLHPCRPLRCPPPLPPHSPPHRFTHLLAH